MGKAGGGTDEAGLSLREAAVAQQAERCGGATAKRAKQSAGLALAAANIYDDNIKGN